MNPHAKTVRCERCKLLLGYTHRKNIAPSIYCETCAPVERVQPKEKPLDPTRTNTQRSQDDLIASELKRLDDIIKTNRS